MPGPNVENPLLRNWITRVFGVWLMGSIALASAGCSARTAATPSAPTSSLPGASTSISTPSPKPPTLAGRISIATTTYAPAFGPGESLDPSKTCDDYGPNVVSGVTDSEQLIVRDGAGSVVGTAALLPGPIERPDPDKWWAIVCQYEFEVQNLKDADFYTVEVGGHKTPVLSAEDLAARDWSLSLSY